MVLRKLMGLVVCVLVISSASLATAGIPDMDLTLANMTGAPTQSVALFNLPNGDGSPFTEAAILNDGTLIDATITMIVIDGTGAIIPDYPAEDMWLQSLDVTGGLAACTGGTVADFNTDVDGETTWADPMYAGGTSTAACQIVINGLPLEQVPFSLYFNSADINGDGTVNLIDVGLFSGIYYGTYDFSADFVADGAMNLLDVGRLAEGAGTSCP